MALEPFIAMRLTAKLNRLNPCSNGMALEQLRRDQDHSRVEICLNPCSNGMALELTLNV